MTEVLHVPRSRVVGGPSSLIGALRRSVQSSQGDIRSYEEIEQETLQLTEALWNMHGPSQTSPAPAIPTFFKPKPKPGSLMELIERQSRIRREQAKAELALDEASLRTIWALIEELAIHDGDIIKMNYDIFCQIGTRARELYGKAVDAHFRPSTFARFMQDREGCISANVFTSYLGARSAMHGVHLQLSMFDDNDNGYLSELQLQDFMRTMAQELPGVRGIEESFLDQYSHITSRKFLFFHGKNGAVRIRDLLTSPWMQELMELRNPELAEMGPSLISNWFSLQSARRVHNTFMALDEDGNGQLSRAEFSQISNGSMSPLFIQRIFEEHVMKQRDARMRSTGAKLDRDEMDLMAFTDFVLAWDHRAEPAAIKYFFPIMDLNKSGVLSPTELYTFFKEIHVMWVDMGEYADLSVHDVVDEIIDMVQPKQPPLIRATDLAACRMSGIFFSMLSDVKQFYEYNNRETLMHQDDNE